MNSIPSIGTVLAFLALFAVCAMAAGFFKAAMQQRKIDKETEKQKQLEKEQAEKEKAKARRKGKEPPKPKRLGE